MHPLPEIDGYKCTLRTLAAPVGQYGYSILFTLRIGLRQVEFHALQQDGTTIELLHSLHQGTNYFGIS